MKIKEKEVKIEDRYIRWFSEIGKEKVKEVGGKAANLGEMLKIRMPVPQGFAINSQAYLFFLEETGLKEKIYKMLEKLDVDNTAKLEETAREIRELIVKKEIPKDLKEEILEAYNVLGVPFVERATKDVASILKMAEPAFVAVRSSANAEDSSIASFAGQQETFLNVKGSSNLIEAVKKCFASLFTSRSIYYRVKKGFKHEDVLIAVIIQLMIDSDKSGVIFSKDPVTREENVVIEAVFGLGEGIVSGRIQPDNYLISRELEILEKKIGDKKIAIVRNSAGETETIKLTEERSKQQVLNDYEIKRLSSYALRLEEHYKIAQDIEFAISSGEIFIVQTRPVTTLEKKIKKEEIHGKEILRGLAASPGIGVGEVKIILDLKDLDKIKKGDILVTKMTNPDMVVSMQKCAAIITDSGGLTAHASIVSREMGIPAIVGTGNATQVLKDGMIVTVDGFNGKIYEGKLEELKEKKVEIKSVIKTETKMKVIVDLPSAAERASKTEIKEVGLLRLEGIIAESGKHPYYFFKNKEIEKYQDIIFSGIKKIAEYFDSLWIRTSDIRSDEFRNLEGSSKEIEVNPMLGMHGIRYSLKHKDILRAELKAMKRLAEEKKIGIMMPQVISLDELKEVKKVLQELEIKLNENIKLGVMIETPAAVEIIEELCKEGISFISFGTNDLTQYTLAIDRGNEQVQYLYDEMHPAVLSQLKKVIEVCKKYKVETSICGQAGSKKEMVEFLVKLGIDSISVNADKAFEISLQVKDLEEKGLRGVSLKEEKGEEKYDRKGKYDIICQECNKKAEVPFKPKPNLPVYCKDCYLRKKRSLEKEELEEIREEEKEEKEREEEKPAEEKTEKYKVEKKEEPKSEEYPDTDFGSDVFSSQEKEREEIIKEIKKQEKEEKITEEEKIEALEKEAEEKAEEEKEIEKEKSEEIGEKEEELEEEEVEEEKPLEPLELINKEIEEKIDKVEDIEKAEEILDIF